MKYTDEQLLNLVNQTITRETDFIPDDMTGGSVQISITGHGNVKYKVHLFFGYDKNRNTITYTKEIKDVIADLWMNAIRKKTVSLHDDGVADLFGEINELMNGDDDLKESGVKKIGKGSGIGKGKGIQKDDSLTTNLTKGFVREVVDYLNEKLNTKYRATSAKTMDAVKARVNEGYSIDDFKIVINKKADAWSKDPKMVRYLRPETLFGPKFEGYLNELSKKSSLDIKNTQYSKDEEF